MTVLVFLLWNVFAAATSNQPLSQEVYPDASQKGSPVRIEEDAQTGLELWQTALGRMWIPAPGNDVIRHLLWEQTVQKVYHHPSVHVLPGDVVIDCGAHIGAFTRVALAAGARLVVAIEPEKANILAFRRNLAEEMKSGRVILIEKGVWDVPGKLPLHVSPVGDSHSVVLPQTGGKEEAIEVTTIDALSKTLKLSRVDFMKMDIEGAEQKALRGSTQVLKRFHPRLAISSYHLKGDPASICSIVWQAHPEYLVDSKDLLKSQDGSAVPKVLFFR